MPKLFNEKFAEQIVDAFGRLTRAHIKYQGCPVGADRRYWKTLSDELAESEKNLTCLLTEMQSRSK